MIATLIELIYTPFGGGSLECKFFIDIFSLITESEGVVKVEKSTFRLLADFGLL